MAAGTAGGRLKEGGAGCGILLCLPLRLLEGLGGVQRPSLPHMVPSRLPLCLLSPGPSKFPRAALGPQAPQEPRRPARLSHARQVQRCSPAPPCGPSPDLAAPARLPPQRPLAAASGPSREQ